LLETGKAWARIKIGIMSPEIRVPKEEEIIEQAAEAAGRYEQMPRRVIR